MFKLSINCYIAPFREIQKSFTKNFFSDDDIYIIRQGLRSTEPIDQKSTKSVWITIAHLDMKF